MYTSIIHDLMVHKSSTFGMLTTPNVMFRLGRILI